MSFIQTVTKSMNDAVYAFVLQVANQYNLDQDEVYSLWTGSSVQSLPPLPTSTNNSQLEKLNKKELVELCKAKGIRHTGTKNDLIVRLSGQDTITTSKKTETKATSKDPPVVKNLVAKIPTVPIRRNQFGNFEHPETSLVFNNKTQKVFGKQNDDGTVEDLTPEDIDICNKYKFSYQLPENLDKKLDLADVKVEELEEELSEGEEFEEEELIEEEDEEEFEEEEYEEFVEGEDD